MSTRHPRDGLRDRWLQAIPTADIGLACKVLLLWLVSTQRVTPRGALSFPHDVVAQELGWTRQRVTDRITEAREAGLLDKVGGGYRGRVAEYVATIPTRSAVLA